VMVFPLSLSEQEKKNINKSMNVIWEGMFFIWFTLRERTCMFLFQMVLVLE